MKEQTDENTSTLELAEIRQTKGTVVFEEMRQDDERRHTFYMLRPLWKNLGEPSKIFLTIETD